jgi:hypothetical protein
MMQKSTVVIAAEIRQRQKYNEAVSAIYKPGTEKYDYTIADQIAQLEALEKKGQRPVPPFSGDDKSSTNWEEFPHPELSI